ncbi:unnamed protein product, partial [marine sediment metagenome]
RSIRNYQPNKPVPNELISQILDAARYAPSSGNLQNWKIILVSDSDKKVELATAALRQNWITTAPVLIVVCNDPADVKRLFKDRGELLYSIQNIAAFVQNVLLLAHSFGLATCWVGAFDPNAVKRVLRTPDGVEPEAIIALGYPAEEVDTPQRKTIDQIAFFETWGNAEKGFGAFPLEKHKGKVEEVQKKGKGFLGKIFSKK